MAEDLGIKVRVDPDTSKVQSQLDKKNNFKLPVTVAIQGDEALKGFKKQLESISNGKYSVRVTVKPDATGLQKQLDNISKNLKFNIQLTDTAGITKMLDKVSDQLEKSAAKMQNNLKMKLGTGFKASASVVTSMNNDIGKLETKISSIGNAVEKSKLEAKFNAIKSSYQEILSSGDISLSGFSDLQQQLSSIKEECENVVVAEKKIADAQAEVDRQTKRNNEAAEKDFKKQTDAANKLYDAIQKSRSKALGNYSSVKGTQYDSDTILSLVNSADSSVADSVFSKLEAAKNSFEKEMNSANLEGYKSALSDAKEVTENLTNEINSANKAIDKDITAIENKISTLGDRYQSLTKKAQVKTADYADAQSSGYDVLMDKSTYENMANALAKASDAKKAFEASMTSENLAAYESALNDLNTAIGKFGTELGVAKTNSEKAFQSISGRVETLNSKLNTLKQFYKNSGMSDSGIESVIGSMETVLTGLRDLDNMPAESMQYKDLVSIFEDMDEVAKSAGVQINSLTDLMKALGIASNDALAKIRAFNAENQDTQGVESLQKRLKNLRYTLTRYYESNPKIQGNQDLVNQYEAISTALKNAAKSADRMDLSKDLSSASKEVAAFKAQVQELGLEGQTLSQIFQNLFGQHFNTMIAMAGIHAIQNSLQQIFQNILDIDTAMTELKKVTDETADVYDRFLDRSTKAAKDLGADISDLVNTTADWARLGYSMEDAETLAKVSTMYKNVGDGIETAAQASEYLISTMKGFGADPTAAEHILDAINAVSNTQPVSSQDLGEIMKRSSAAMSAANNTIEETIALATAMNSVLQDSAKTGTTLKTVSMYLRATKTELEEAGESTEGMAETTSKLREQLLALTHGQVDIQLDEDTYKSTYQIFEDMADAWDDMTDKEHAAALELMGGKRNANAVQAVIQQFQIAEDALETAQDSAGSAMAENEKYLDSIQGKLNIFQSTFESVSYHLVDSEAIKFVLDLGTAMLGLVDGLTQVAGAAPIATSAISALISLLNIDTKGSAFNLFNLFGTSSTSNGKKLTISGMTLDQFESEYKQILSVMESVKDLTNINVSKKNVFGALLFGNGRNDYDATKNLKEDIAALQELLKGISSGGNVKELLPDIKKNSNISEYFEEFADKIDGTGKSLEELNNTYIPKYITSTTGAATTTTAFGATMSALGKQAIAVGAQLITSFAIGFAINLAIASLIKLGEAIEDIANPGKALDEKIQSLSGTVSGYTTEIDQLQSELDSTIEKMRELENADAGEYVDQQEIDKLKAATIELDNQLKLKKMLREEEATELNNTVKDRANLENFYYLGDSNSVADVFTKRGALWENAKGKEVSLFGDMKSVFHGTDVEYLDALIERYDQYKVQLQELEEEYNKGLIDPNSYMEKKGSIESNMSNISDTATETIGKIQDLNEQLDENGEGYEEQSAIFNSAISKYVEWNEKSVQGLTDLQRATTAYNDALANGDESASKLKAAIGSGIISQGSEEYQYAASLADRYGVSVDSLIQSLKEATTVNEDYIGSTTELSQAAISSSQSLVANIDKVTEALESQSAASGVSTEAYDALIEADSSYAAALETSNGHIKLNRDIVEKLTDAKIEEAKANIELAYSQNQMKYAQVKDDIETLDKAYKNNMELTEEQKQLYQDSRAELEEQSKALRENCESLKLQYDALVQASSAYQDWLNAQNASEAGDMADDALKAAAEIQDGLENGKIGTVKFKSSVEFLVPDNMQDAVQDYYKTIRRYLQEDDDGNLKAEGINNFLEDSVSKGLMSTDGNGFYSIVEGTTLKDFADQLNITMELAQALFGVLQDYGWTFDWGDMLGNSIDNIRMQIDDLQDQMDALGPGAEGSDEWNLLNEQITNLKEELKNLYDPSESGLDQMAADVQSAIDAAGGEMDAFQADMLNSNGRVQAAVDLANAKAELAALENELNGKTQLSLVDIQNLTKAQDEVERLTQEKEALGEPTSVEIEAYIKSDSEVETARKIQELSDAGVLKLDTTSADSAVGEVKKTTDQIKDEAGSIVMEINTTAAQTNIDNVKKAIDNIPTEKTFTINIKTKGTVGGLFSFNLPKAQSSGKKSSGASSAAGGISEGGKTLVGELGNEIVVNPRTGKWYTVGDNGAEFVNLPKDAIVFDHEKTKELLGNGVGGGHGTAYAGGSGIPNYPVGGGGWAIGSNPATSKTYTNATKDNTKAVDANRKALEAQKEALEKQKEAYEKESNALKIYGQAAINEIDKRIEALNKEKEAQQDNYQEQIKQLEEYQKKQNEAYDKQIEALEEKKKALQKANDEEDRALELAELEEALARAQSQKTVRIYNENEGFVWRADQESVNNAQEDLDDQKREWADEDALDAIDEEIDKINDLKDALDESVESQIEAIEERQEAMEESFDSEIEKLEDLKDQWNDAMSLIGTSWEDYQLQLQAAAEFSGMSFEAMAAGVSGYKDAIIENMQQIGDTDAQINRVTDAIKALESTAGGGGSGGGGGEGGSEISGGVGEGTEVGGESSAGSGMKSFTEQLKEAGGVSDETANRMSALRNEISQTGEETLRLQENEAALTASLADSSMPLTERTEKMAALKETQQGIADNQEHMAELSAQYVEVLGNETTATDEARRVASEALTALTEQYGISYETIFGKLDEYVNKLIITGTGTSEQFTSMSDTVSAFSTSVQQQMGTAGGSFDSFAGKAESMAKRVTDACNTAMLQMEKLSHFEIPSFPSVGPGFASGIINSNTTRLALTDENGPEIRVRSNKGSYSVIEQGTSVIPANPSEVLWKFGMNPDDFIAKHMKRFNVPQISLETPSGNGVSIGDINIEMNGVNDVESFGEVLARKAPSIIAQTFSRRR